MDKFHGQALHPYMESATNQRGRNHHILHQGWPTPHLHLKEETFVTCDQGQIQEVAIEPGLPLQTLKACEQQGSKEVIATPR